MASSTSGLTTQSSTVHVVPRWSTVDRGGEERCIGMAKAASAVFFLKDGSSVWADGGAPVR